MEDRTKQILTKNLFFNNRELRKGKETVKRERLFLTKIFEAWGDLMINEEESIRVFLLGDFEIQRNSYSWSNSLKNNCKKAVNWKETYDFWEKKYGTRDNAELKKITGKKVIYYANLHTGGDFFKVCWKRSRGVLVNKAFYSWEPSKKLKLKLSARIFASKNEDIFFGKEITKAPFSVFD